MLAIEFMVTLLSIALAQDTITRTQISSAEASDVSVALSSHAVEFVEEVSSNNPDIPEESAACVIQVFESIKRFVFQPSTWGIDRDKYNADTPDNEATYWAQVIESGPETTVNEPLYTQFWQGETSPINEVLASPTQASNDDSIVTSSDFAASTLVRLSVAAAVAVVVGMAQL